MQKSPITIQVDPEVAEAYATASEAERSKLELLVNLHLKGLFAGPRRPLGEVMDEIGEEAAARGLTPAILESILRDESDG